MKSKIFFLLFTVLLFTYSCTSSDEPAPAQNEPISNAWRMKNVSGGLIGLNINYNDGDVTWDFDTSTNMVCVENNIMTTGPESIYAVLQTGIYTFEIVQNGAVQTLYIDSVERGNITIQGDSLLIDDGIAADGFLTLFIR